jgi:hypothetical protein
VILIQKVGSRGVDKLQDTGFVSSKNRWVYLNFASGSALENISWIKISAGLLTQASPYSPGLPIHRGQWHMWVFVSYYSCGAVADFHRFPVTEILIDCVEFKKACFNRQKLFCFFDF